MLLLQNDRAFGLLLAESGRSDFLGRFRLDQATYLSVEGSDICYLDFPGVHVYQGDGIWFAQDVESGRFFPNPSQMAYRSVYLTFAEFKRLQYFRAEGVAQPVFSFAQERFGKLPGFSHRPKSWFRRASFSAPEKYATARGILPASKYILAEAA